jgi:hypothetical protein
MTHGDNNGSDGFLNGAGVKLIWPEKESLDRRSQACSLPFQVIEIIEEARATREFRKDSTMPLFEASPP